MLLLAARPATRLGPHLLLAGGCVLVVLAVVAVAWISTRRRLRSQGEPAPTASAGLPALPVPPRPFPLPLIEPMDGVALGTTEPQGWQDAGVGGLVGSRRSGTLTVTCGGIDLAGLWLPRTALRSVRVDERFATKFMPGAGLLIFGWEGDGRHFESGFRGAASRYEEVVATVRGLLDVRVTEGSS